MTDSYDLGCGGLWRRSFSLGLLLLLKFHVLTLYQCDQSVTTSLELLKYNTQRYTSHLPLCNR